MELKNYLVELLSNIIHDKLKMLSDTKNDMCKVDDYKRIEDLFSDVNNILDVNDDDLRTILSDITDEHTINDIISNVDMIKIVLNGKNMGLDLSLDSNQEKLIHGVYDIVNDYRVTLENKNTEMRSYLEDFISKCQSLSDEIGSGVVRDVDTLDFVLDDSNVAIEDVVKCKFEILRNNNKNYSLDLDGKVREEVELRIALKKIDFDFDSYNSIEKQVLVNYGDIDRINSIIDYISSNGLKVSSRNLFILMLFSDSSILSSIYDLCSKYELNFDRLFMMPGVFIKSSDLVQSIISESKDLDDYYAIEFLENIGSYYDNFINNVSLISNTRSVKACFDNNMLSLIIPDMSKNIEILSSISLSDSEFSVVVINPFLATSISSFSESGLSEYIKHNPMRLTTSYYRFRDINLRIIDARRNGKVIFRSLSDKKNIWFSRSITAPVSDSEVI